MCLEILEFDVEWKGEGVDEVCIDANTDKVIIDISKNYFRPSEVETLLGDSTKARKQLGWKPTYDLYSLTKEMIDHDLAEIE